MAKSRMKNLGQSKTFLTSKVRPTFIKLKQVFVETAILNHFNLECYIYIEIDALGYTIGKILN